MLNGVLRSNRMARFSCDQPRVGQSLAAQRVDETVQPLKRVPLHVAVVQSPGELVNVPAKVLGTGMMVNPMQTSLQNRPNRFDAVRAGRTPRVLTDAMAKGGETAAKAPVKPAEDIADLKEEMEAMRRQLAELSQRK